MNDINPPSPMKFFSNLEEEHEFKLASVVGEIPKSINGTLYRNGVGIFELFGRRYKHTFEGDGAISAIKFENSKAYTSVKIIKSLGLQEELNKIKNLFGSKAPWLTRFMNGIKGRRKNTANTHIISWQNKLYALMEGAKPTEIRKDDLATMGETSFEGVISGTFSAHPHYVTSRKAFYNFGLEYGKETKLNFYELPDTGKAQKIGTIALDWPVMLHDFIVTSNYLIFFIAPANLNVGKMLLSIGSFIDCLEWKEESGTEIVVVPISDPSNVHRFKTKAFFASHFGGAFEENDEIFVDYIHYSDIQIFENLGDGSELRWENSENHSHGNLCRAKINLLKKAFESHSRWDGFCEFPRLADKFSGEKYSYLWLQSEEYIEDIFRSSISKINEQNEVLTYILEIGQLCSEPVPILDKNGDEDSGYIITLVFDSKLNKSHYLLLTANDLKLQAKIELDQVIPITFHGSWIENSIV